MSYDFSFEKSQMWLLGALAALGSVLLIAAGFLIGRITMTPADASVGTSTGVTASPVRPATAVAVPMPSVGGPVLSTPSQVLVPLPDRTSASSVAGPDTSADVTGVASSGSAATAVSGVVSGDVYALAAPGYTLQYGAFREPANAKDLLKQLAEQKVIASMVTMTNAYGEGFSVVRSGTYATVVDARQAALEQANKLRMPIVVRPAGRL